MKYNYITETKPFFDNGEAKFLWAKNMSVADLMDMCGGKMPPKSFIQRYEDIKMSKEEIESRWALMCDSMRVRNSAMEICLSDYDGTYTNLNGGHNSYVVQYMLDKNGPSVIEGVSLNVCLYHCTTRAAEVAIWKMQNVGGNLSAQDTRAAELAANAATADLARMAESFVNKEISSEDEAIYKAISPTAAATRSSIMQAMENISSRMMEGVTNGKWKFGYSGMSGQAQNALSMYEYTSSEQRFQALQEYARIIADAPVWMMSKTPEATARDGALKKRASLVTKCGFAANVLLNSSAPAIIKKLQSLPISEQIDFAKLLEKELEKSQIVWVGNKSRYITAIESGNSQSASLYEAQKNAFAAFYKKAAKKMEV